MLPYALFKIAICLMRIELGTKNLKKRRISCNDRMNLHHESKEIQKFLCSTWQHIQNFGFNQFCYSKMIEFEKQLKGNYLFPTL
jgi:hypothetical protein